MVPYPPLKKTSGSMACSALTSSDLTQASVPARTGAPDGDGCQGTPANLSAPVVAKVRHRASCRAFRTLTQKAPAAAMRGQLTEVFAGRMAISGGSSDTDVKEPI